MIKTKQSLKVNQLQLPTETVNATTVAKEMGLFLQKVYSPMYNVYFDQNAQKVLEPNASIEEYDFSCGEQAQDFLHKDACENPTMNVLQAIAAVLIVFNSQTTGGKKVYAYYKNGQTFGYIRASITKQGKNSGKIFVENIPFDAGYSNEAGYVCQ